MELINCKAWLLKADSVIIPGMLARIYALSFPDCLNVMEEQLHYFMLTGNRLATRVIKSQLTALRFTSYEECVESCHLMK
ncbi:DUF6526 family protein [Sporosarcina sp. GW1-11]|uniref:DUF6526 family protein n=1 Tax=Sporosarcina sp. GW1-11 TaxID=2899126 RepID=UPI00294F92F9|nr:DUF6526 family protein [Sporosarcina sp. GW1-11]MDV6378668.1 DUF6526 family protein [Sporosarcina sp. GW1-11]